MIALWVMGCVLSAAPVASKSDSDAALEKETAAWHQSRKERLRAEDGWFTLVGLVWLGEGDSVAGSADSSKVKLPASLPATVGTFTRKGEEVSFTPASGVTVEKEGKPFPGGAVASDAKGSPDILRLGSVRMFVVRRGDRFGVRIKDADAPARKAFSDIERYPVHASWKVQARFVKDPKTLNVPTVLGTQETMQSPGTLMFELGGKQYSLRPVVEDGDTELFLIFGDATNKDTTYGAGRFLTAPMPVNGMTVLDFNRAYNPPCAFSSFATCPVPPVGNKLAVRIEAGEKRYGPGHP